MENKYNFKFYDCLPEESKNIRTEVFKIEQGFQNEFDDIDNISTHLVYYDGNLPIGTARFFIDNNSNEYHIGRIAVVKEYRGKNIGKKIMLAIENKLKESGVNSVSLSAQTQAKDFYLKCGYVEEGDIYLDEHCPHIKMTKSF